MTLVHAARDIAARGWVPVAIPPREKGPRYKGWQTSTLTGDGRIAYTADGGTIVSTFEAMFGPVGNVGIVLGDPSGGLIDVDIDDPAGHAMRLAPQFLPATATFGRASKPESHWLYQCGVPAGPRESLNAPIAPLYEAHRYNAQQRSVTLVEVRGTGVQTMAPGSVHPSGERVRWDRDVTPVGIARAELDLRVARLAMAALLVQAGTSDAAALRMTLAATPVELAAMAPSSAVDMVRSWPACRILRPPEPPPMVRSEVAAAGFDAAKARYNADRTPSWPNKCIPCPVCGSTASFKALSTNSAKWVCWSTNHPDGCGVATKGGDKAEFTGDALDLDSYAAGRTPKEHLLAEGYLEPYVDRLADPDLIDLVRGGELARQDWDAVRAAQPKAEKAKGKAKAEAPQMHGSHEIRFATASDTELSGALIDDTKTDDGEGGKVAMVWDEGQFWRYEAGVWRSLDDKSLERHVHGFDGVYCFDPDDEDSKKRPWKLKMTHGRVVGVVASTRAMLHRDHWFDHAPTGVMFSDVFVTIDDHGQIRGEYVSPEHRQRHRLEQDSGPLAFTPGAIPAMYVDLIRRGFGPCVDLEEKVQLWREWAGLALLGRQTFRRAMFLLGDSGSGKSVTAKVLLGLLPDVAKTSMTMANIDPVGFGKSEYYLADLSTSRINADLDVRASLFVAGENFMKLVSQDPIAARQPGGKTFTFKPRTAMLMAGETLPTPDNKNPGFFNRFIILRFAGGAVAEGQAVYEYERNILEAERAEIASWLIEGAAMAIQRGRFEIPASVQHERQAWAQAVDSVHLWLVECTTDSSIVDPNDWVKAGVLFGHYREWCGKNGYQPVAINKFGERLRKALPAERWSEQSRDRQTRYRVRVLSQSEMEALR